MKIGLIGSGRMAQAMGGYLKDRGYEIFGLWGRNREKSRTASGYLGVPHHDNLADLVSGAEVLILAVSDDAILSVAKTVADSGVDLEGKWVCHLSGSLSLDMLDSMMRRGALGFSLHPLQTVPEADHGRKDLRYAAFVLEADEGLRDRLNDWLTPCGNRTAWISSGKKGLYHLGACLASNYVMTLYRLAEEALIDSGVQEEIASKALLPLMESTLNNYRSIGALAGLTGPVSRGDGGTVKKHLDSLQTMGWEHREALIRALGLEALDIAQKCGRMDTETAMRMKRILSGGTEG